MAKCQSLGMVDSFGADSLCIIISALAVLLPRHGSSSSSNSSSVHSVSQKGAFIRDFVVAYRAHSPTDFSPRGASIVSKSLSVLGRPSALKEDRKRTREESGVMEAEGKVSLLALVITRAGSQAS